MLQIYFPAPPNLRACRIRSPPGDGCGPLYFPSCKTSVVTKLEGAMLMNLLHFEESVLLTKETQKEMLITIENTGSECEDLPVPQSSLLLGQQASPELHPNSPPATEANLSKTLQLQAFR